ncbi:hypothetical protein O3P69_000222 [Scylla paramamosain]|uniref:Uncharacterized protein n=1 Tax=Scylla paramamosain TaxID=85552 RepID=A0AAW0UV45_SCYPA
MCVGRRGEGREPHATVPQQMPVSRLFLPRWTINAKGSLMSDCISISVPHSYSGQKDKTNNGLMTVRQN